MALAVIIGSESFGKYKIKHIAMHTAQGAEGRCYYLSWFPIFLDDVATKPCGPFSKSHVYNNTAQVKSRSLLYYSALS